MESILHYSESDFPSLDPNSRRKNASTRSAVHVPPFGKTAVEVESAGVIEILSSSRSGRNSSRRKLKPHEHEVSYSISINEAIVKTRKQTSIKNKPIGVKSSVRNERICGNPLDADNPLRLKGKFGLPKKPKHISRTKKNVMQARENVSKAKELATNVTFEAGWIHHDSKLEEENLRNVLFLAKLTEMRETLKRLNADSDDAPKMRADRNKNKEAIDLSPEQNVTDFRKILESSSVPIHLLLIHNHNFKRYCDNCIYDTLNERATALISQIVRFQQNKYQRNPVKAVANKRYVSGFKQTMKYMRMNKIKMIICVPDMEDSMTELVEELKLLANAYSMPYLFALIRRKLGALTYKKVGVCCFGILDYSSAEDNFNRLNEEAFAAKRTYREKCSSAVEYCQLNFGITRRLSKEYEALGSEKRDSGRHLRILDTAVRNMGRKDFLGRFCGEVLARVVGMHIRLKLVSAPAEAKTVPLGKKRKKGRPSRAKKALGRAVGSKNQRGAEESNTDVGTLTAETEEKLRLNEYVNVEN